MPFLTTSKPSRRYHHVHVRLTSPCDPSLACRRAGKRSRNNTCVAITCEEAEPPKQGRSDFRMLGLGKTSGERTKAAYCPHIAEGCTLVHDKESEHNAVVRKPGLVSEAYDSHSVRCCPTTRTRSPGSIACASCYTSFSTGARASTSRIPKTGSTCFT